MNTNPNPASPFEAPTERSRLGQLARLLGLTTKDEREADTLVAMLLEDGRLGRRPYLLLAEQASFDYDGLTTWIYLLESFESEIDAVIRATKVRGKLLVRYLRRRHASGGRWMFESEGVPVAPPFPLKGDGPTQPAPGETPIRCLCAQSFKVRDLDDEFHRDQITLRVVGPFPGEIIGPELVQVIPSRQDLRSYFDEIARAKRGFRAPPRPGPRR